MASNIIDEISSIPSDILGNKDVGEKVKTLDTWIRKENDLTAFVYFSVNGFELDSRSSKTEQHYITYMENQKTGAGQGNKFTIKIVFHQDFDDKKRNILEFEKQLADAPKNRNVCELQYGYLNGMSSPKYVGFLLQYEVTANKQLVEYTLSGVSGEQTSSIATVNWYPMLDGINEKGEAQVNLEKLSIHALYTKDRNEIAKYNEKIKEFNQQYNTPIKMNPFDALCRFVWDYNYFLKKVYDEKKGDMKSYTQFKIVDETGLGKIGKRSRLETYLQSVNISVCRNQSATEYIEYLVGLFQKKTSDIDGVMLYYMQNKEVVDRFVYEFKYDTSSNKVVKTIKIVIRRLTSEDNSCAYTFSNYTPDNRMLLDYTLKYDGTVALTAQSNYSNSLDKEDEEDKKIYIDSNGKIVSKAVLTKEMFVAGSLEEVVAKSSNSWLDKISCSNNCTMKTIGIPFEIPIGTVFAIQSYIGDVLHHQSGRCYTVGVVDRIQNNMFTTDFTMVRLPGKYAGIESL